MTHPFRFRADSTDEDIFSAVVLRNEYGLPEAFDPRDIVVDVGAHVGSFCYAALRRGAGRVHGFEPNRANFDLATRNLQDFGGRVALENVAVWRSDRPAPRLSLTPNPTNDAAGHVLLPGGAQAVVAVPFDPMIWRVTGRGRARVRLLKIDCEGSEFPILLTSHRLRLIDEIVGEYHEYGLGDAPHVIPEVARVRGYDRYTKEELFRALRRAGFRIVSVTPHPDPGVPTGIFRAVCDPSTARRGRLASLWGWLRGESAGRPPE